MRRISFLFSIIAILLLFTNCTNNQTSNSDYIISLEEAEQILLTEVFQDSIPFDKEIFKLTEPLERFAKIKSALNQYTINNKSWFFFIDDCPMANWSHPCRYVLISYYHVWETNYCIIDEDWPPSCFEDMVEVEFK